MKLSELPPYQPAPELRSGRVVVRYERNRSGRDFVVGDIHGMFPHLRSLLDEIEFDPATDRLFSVGDLVDRGPESDMALEWLDHAWFHACRGNHEQFVIDSIDPVQYDLWINHNGGAWWLDLDDASRVQFRDVFANLPLAIEVETATGVVGIIHADVPPLVAWSRFMELLRARDRDAALYALWSRNRVQGSGPRLPVRGGWSGCTAGIHRHGPRSVSRTCITSTPARCTFARDMPVRDSRWCRSIRRSIASTRYGPLTRREADRKSPAVSGLDT